MTEMTFYQVLEAYKNGQIDWQTIDLTRSESVMVFNQATFLFESAIFLKYSTGSIHAVRDKTVISESFKLWFTFNESTELNNGNDDNTSGEESTNQDGNEATQGQSEDGGNAGNDNGTPSDNGSSASSNGESSGNGSVSGGD